MLSWLTGRRARLLLLASGFCLLASGCRQDMQDQPRYEAYEQSKFFADGQASRPYVEGTVARGYLREDSAFYTGRRAAGQAAGGAGAQQQGAGGTTQNVLQMTSPNTQGSNSGSTPGGDVNVRGNVGGRVGVPAGETQAAGGRDDLVNEFPFQITKADLDRGQERFQAYCLMCHGATGYGDGMIVRRGFRQPPSFHDDRLRGEPLGHFFDVITNGWGAMASYSDMIPPDDRWRIIAYIRALQLSQNAPVAGAVAPTTQPQGAPQQQPSQGVNAPSGTRGTNR